MTRLVRYLGALVLDQLESLGRMGVFLYMVVRGIARPPGKYWFTVKQIQFIGTKSFFVIGFTATFTGMVLSLQGYYTLSKFGSEGLLGSAVALSLIRELGPVLTALMVTGRAGSAMCAEIGIMRIEEQIDALECMAIDPFSYLITPKLIAGLIALPLLTAYCDVVGIFGGYLVSVQLLGVSAGSFMDGLTSSVVWEDVYMGIVKSFSFAVLMIWICSYKGYYAGLDQGSFGPEEVSQATTQAVVYASISVLMSDYVITSILL
ncbi:MlaE family ABC transporter permease [Desulforhabdus amnigena]|jgi:phospholipid/cholesterol/gamma-HCH transport system permease protein|uniref:ABC transporter permease n=1 Tax=Desulforhabdus amnigena TaxID=40218 RepID=A0A9W6FTU9_9BACT|nr:MlaE family lipid ABC transporter permease subunit [Desulforhabdus amnigena]NLJ29218.1 ABC transporter permease [Deltaproteobacteria bacterium]GLI34236.1 ABC transporter permease [Desulforhabdus amnigena]